MSTFLAMSVSGGALILVIAVLRALFAQHLPRRLLCALWAVALLRLLLPVFPPSPLSLLPAVESGGGEALPAAAAPTPAPLLRLEEMRARPLPLGSAFGKSGVEKRIAAIVRRRPVSLYAPYGLGMYDGRLYYGAEGVRSFLDGALGVEEYSHLPTATLDLRAVRDASGSLTGLRVATAEESAAIAGDLHEDEAPPQQGGPLGSVEPAEDWY